MIDRVPVLIGYSLDDPDWRQVWSFVGERLGRQRRKAYCVTVGALPVDIRRFERRGVTVISLPGDPKDYDAILAAAFGQLHAHWQNALLDRSPVTREDAAIELRLPLGKSSRLCFVAVPQRRLALWRELVFPAVERLGIVPVTVDDVTAPGESLLATTSALLGRAHAAVIDVSSGETRPELTAARGALPPERILTVLASPDPDALRDSVEPGQQLAFVSDLEEELAAVVGAWLREHFPIGGDEQDRVRRLMAEGDWKLALVVVCTELEALLRRIVEDREPGRRTRSFRDLINVAVSDDLLSTNLVPKLLEAYRTRSEIVHTDADVSEEEARPLIAAAMQAVEAVRARLPSA